MKTDDASRPRLVSFAEGLATASN